MWLFNTKTYHIYTEKPSEKARLRFMFFIKLRKTSCSNEFQPLEFKLQKLL